MSIFGIKKPNDRHVELSRLWFGNQAFSVLITGNSRSGKTILLSRLMNDYIKLGHKNFINDCAKGYDYATKEPKSELLIYQSPELDAIKKIRAFVPPNCNITIIDPEKELTKPFEVIAVTSYGEIFKKIQEGGNTLNVITIPSFLLAPLAKARFWALWCIELQNRSAPDPEKETLTPLVGALDQINHIFPSRALRLSGAGKVIQEEAANQFATFMQDAAGNGFRLLGTTHTLPIVKKSVRMAFLWNIFKTSSSDITDIAKRLTPAQKIIENLKIDEMYVVDDSNHGDKVPFLPDVKYPSKPVYYHGERIQDPYWMLDSEYQSLVMSAQELKTQEKGIDLPGRRKRTGNMWLLGLNWDDISEENEITRRTVAEDMKWNRQDHFYVALERYRDYIQKQEAKRIADEIAALRNKTKGIET